MDININYRNADSESGIIKEGLPKMLFWWQAVSRWSLIILVFLAPIFFLPLTDLTVAVNKEILVFILIFTGLFATLGRILVEGRIRYPGHLITVALLALVLVWAASAFFSVSQIGSLIGSWGTPDSLVSILLFAILALFIAMTFERRDIMLSLLVFLASLSILGLFELLQLLKVFILPFDFSKSIAFNPVGSVNSLGILLAFGLIIASGIVSAVDTTKFLKKFLGISIIIFILNLFIIDFWAIWIGLILAMIFMISFFSAGLRSVSESPSSIRRTDGWFAKPDKFGFGEPDEKEISSASREYQGLQLAYFEKAWLPSVILLISLFLLFIPSPLARFIQTPVEVSLNYGTTLNTAFLNLKASHYFLGSGPNTFSYIFNLYKPTGINQTIFWSTVFNSGASALTTWIGTLGILGLIVLLFLIAAFVWTSIIVTSIKSSSRGIMNVVSQSLFVAVIFMFILWFLYPANFTLMVFTFLGIGLFLAASLPAKPIKFRFGEIIAIFTSPPKTFLFSLLIVALMVGAAIGVYFEINRYLAEIYFSKASVASGQNSSDTISDLSKAIGFWPYDERYFEAMSQAIFLQINDLLARKDLPQETLRSEFQNLTSGAIAYAQKARDLNTQNPFNSLLLGSIYENLIPFIHDAANFALSSYEAATALDPQNPSDRLALARVEIDMANLAASNKAGADEINGHLDKAVADLETAINLKDDYAPARFLEVQIYDQQGKLADAIKRAEELVMLNNSDVGALFQLGFLYYKANRFNDSQLVFEKVILFSPNYSNARYFLGLIYDKNGDKTRSIEQFSKIAELNPDNNEVKQILVNLKAKKPALFGIVPPALAPQNRAEAPVSEGTKALVKPLKK